jgi:hypothetical protein
MFTSSRPPLLVMLVPSGQASLFPQSDGYDAQRFDEKYTIVSYKDGWYFPLSVAQQKIATEPPMLLVRSKGRLTTEGSTFKKGYSHQFCKEDGSDPESAYKVALFSDQPGVEWMLIQNSVTMVWFQYGDKSQYLGESGSDIERINYGKLIIRKFLVEQDYEPKLDKNADHFDLSAKLYRVSSVDFYEKEWSITDQDAEKYLHELLSADGVERFLPSVKAALKQVFQKG